MLEARRNEHNRKCAKFNELSRFTLNQVAIEEMGMDHFEQGLRREVK